MKCIRVILSVMCIRKSRMPRRHRRAARRRTGPGSYGSYSDFLKYNDIIQ